MACGIHLIQRKHPPRSKSPYSKLREFERKRRHAYRLSKHCCRGGMRPCSQPRNPSAPATPSGRVIPCVGLDPALLPVKILANPYKKAFSAMIAVSAPREPPELSVLLMEGTGRSMEFTTRHVKCAGCTELQKSRDQTRLHSRESLSHRP